MFTFVFLISNNVLGMWKVYDKYDAFALIWMRDNELGFVRSRIDVIEPMGIVIDQMWYIKGKKELTCPSPLNLGFQRDNILFINSINIC